MLRALNTKSTFEQMSSISLTFWTIMPFTFSGTRVSMLQRPPRASS